MCSSSEWRDWWVLWIRRRSYRSLTGYLLTAITFNVPPWIRQWRHIATSHTVLGGWILYSHSASNSASKQLHGICNVHGASQVLLWHEGQCRAIKVLPYFTCNLTVMRMQLDNKYFQHYFAFIQIYSKIRMFALWFSLCLPLFRLTFILNCESAVLTWS